MRALLIGNYGVGNMGDEALKTYFLDAFPEIDWIVLSAHPQPGEVARLPAGIRSLVSGRWIGTLRAFRKADAVVFGGGSLWTDVESVFACVLWSLHASAAITLRKPYYLAFQGIGPFKTKAGESLARWAVRHAAFVSVRDRASAERIRSWGLNREIVQTFDPVFSVMAQEKSHRRSTNVCTIIPRMNSSEELMQKAMTLVRMRPHIQHVRVLLMQPEEAGEQAIARRLERELGLPATTLPVTTLAALMQGVAGSTIVLSQRFHGALAALAEGVDTEIVSQGEDDKLAALRNLVDRGFDAAAALKLVATGEQALRQALAA
jgi:polysaccharide pyruvyl transferase WcaK-like protein